MTNMREAQQAWDNALPPDTSRQEREHELACKVAFDRYLKTGDLPGRKDASLVWDDLEYDEASRIVLFDMLKAYRAGDDAELLALAKRVAGRVDNIVNGMIEEGGMSLTIKRNVEVAVQITPEELADAFWGMWQNEQAEFFNRLGGFERLVFQLQAITDDPNLTDEGRHAMGRIGEYATRENNHGS